MRGLNADYGFFECFCRIFFQMFMKINLILEDILTETYRNLIVFLLS